MVHMYNRILFSHKKECISVSSNEVGESRAFYTEWSKSEREKQIPYINAYMWNLQRWYWRSCLQGSNGDADSKNRLIDTGMGLEKEGETNGESDVETYTLP